MGVPSRIRLDFRRFSSGIFVGLGGTYTLLFRCHSYDQHISLSPYTHSSMRTGAVDGLTEGDADLEEIIGDENDGSDKKKKENNEIGESDKKNEENSENDESDKNNDETDNLKKNLNDNDGGQTLMSFQTPLTLILPLKLT